MGAIDFASISLGDQLPTIEVRTSQEMQNRYAAASLDVNPVHINPGFTARTKVFGSESTVAHGMMTMSHMMSVITDWIYDQGGRITRIESKFIRPVFPDSLVIYRGVVTEKHFTPDGGWVTVSLTAELGDGQDQGQRVALGTANVSVP